MTQPPLWDGKGVDPWLPARLAAESRVTAAERKLYNAWWGSFSDWLVKVKRGVMSGAAPDPHAVWAATPEWATRMQAFTQGPVADVMGGAYTALFGPDYLFDARPAVSTYLGQVFNRMVRTPDEVYNVVAAAVAHGAGVGESIPAIADRVDQVLTITGNENWRGRAVTVARTEGIGALNAGRSDSFTAVAESLGGEFEQVWLATIDRATRDWHAEADGTTAAIGQPFTVDGEDLMFPGDPTGSASNVINCRCSTLLQRVGETTDMTGRGFTDADEYWAGQLDDAA
jgi:hypothetical protein